MKCITVFSAALVAGASASAVCPSNSTDLANMNPLLRFKASMVSDDDRSQVFLGNILTAPVENNGTDVSICPGVGLNCCGDTNFQLIADMYQRIANETNEQIANISVSLDQMQSPLQTAASGIRQTADMLSKSVIFKDLAKPLYDGLNSLSDTLSGFSKNYKAAVLKCIAHGKVFWKVGMACAACDANWDTWYNETSLSIMINENQIEQLADACTEILVQLNQVGSSYSDLFAKMSGGFIGSSGYTAKIDMCQANDDCPDTKTATTDYDRCHANLVCRMKGDREHTEPQVHELMKYVQDKLHDISDEGDKQSSAAMATTGQMVNDQGRRRNVAPLVQPLRDGLRTVREIVNRSHKMAARQSNANVQYTSDPSSLQPVTTGQQSALTSGFQSSSNQLQPLYRALYILPVACLAALAL